MQSIAKKAVNSSLGSLSKVGARQQESAPKAANKSNNTVIHKLNKQWIKKQPIT